MSEFKLNVEIDEADLQPLVGMIDTTLKTHGIAVVREAARIAEAVQAASDKLEAQKQANVPDEKAK